jgi:hypothetical protein
MWMMRPMISSGRSWMVGMGEGEGVGGMASWDELGRRLRDRDVSALAQNSPYRPPVALHQPSQCPWRSSSPHLSRPPDSSLLAGRRDSLDGRAQCCQYLVTTFTCHNRSRRLENDGVGGVKRRRQPFFACTLVLPRDTATATI